MQNYLQRPAIFERVNKYDDASNITCPATSVDICAVICSVVLYESSVDKIWLQSCCCMSFCPQNIILEVDFNFNSILYCNYILPSGCAVLSNDSHIK